MPRVESRRATRDKHESTTTRTPGTVIEDSATSVAKITRREPGADALSGLTMRDCSSALSCPCSANALTCPPPCATPTPAPSAPPKRSANVSVARIVGTKASTSPSSVSASARRTPASTKSSIHPPRGLPPEPLPSPAPPGRPRGPEPRGLPPATRWEMESVAEE